MDSRLERLLALLPPGCYAYDMLTECSTRSQLLITVAGLMPNLVRDIPDLKVLQNWLNRTFDPRMLESAGIFVQPEVLPDVVEGRIHVLCADRNPKRLIHPKGALGLYYGQAELNASSGQICLHNHCRAYAENTHLSCWEDSRATLINNCNAYMGDFSSCVAVNNNVVRLTNYASVTTDTSNEEHTNRFRANDYSTVDLNCPGNTVVADGMPLIFDWHEHDVTFEKSGILFQPAGKGKQLTNPSVISLTDMEACLYLRDYVSRRVELRHQPLQGLTKRMPADLLVAYQQAGNDEQRIQLVLEHFDELANRGLTGRELEAVFSDDLLLSHQIYTDRTVWPYEPKGDYYVVGDILYNQAHAQAHGHFADCAVGCVQAGSIESLGHSLGVATKAGQAYGKHLLIGMEIGELVCEGRCAALALGQSSAKANGFANVEATQHASVTAAGRTVTHLKGYAHGVFSGEASFVAEQESSYVCKEKARGCKVIPYANPYLYDPANAKATAKWGTPTGVANVPKSVTTIGESAVKSTLEAYRKEQMPEESHSSRLSR